MKKFVIVNNIKPLIDIFKKIIKIFTLSGNYQNFIFRILSKNSNALKFLNSHVLK